MTLDSMIGASARSNSFLLYQLGTAGWGLLVVASIVLITLLLIIRRKRKLKRVSVLIYQNRQQQLRQKTNKQWENAKTHIEKLLYEMTEHGQNHDSLKSLPQEVLVKNERHNYKMTEQENAGMIMRAGTVRSRQLRKTNSPLDVQELQAVATLAKRLSSRSRQRVSG